MPPGTVRLFSSETVSSSGYSTRRCPGCKRSGSPCTGHSKSTSRSACRLVPLPQVHINPGKIPIPPDILPRSCQSFPPRTAPVTASPPCPAPGFPLTGSAPASRPQPKPVPASPPYPALGFPLTGSAPASRPQTKPAPDSLPLPEPDFPLTGSAPTSRPQAKPAPALPEDIGSPPGDTPESHRLSSRFPPHSSKASIPCLERACISCWYIPLMPCRNSGSKTRPAWPRLPAGRFFRRTDAHAVSHIPSARSRECLSCPCPQAHKSALWQKPFFPGFPPLRQERNDSGMLRVRWYTPRSHQSCPAAPRRVRFSDRNRLPCPLPPNRDPRIPQPSPFYSRGRTAAWQPCQHGIPNRENRTPLPDALSSAAEIPRCAPPPHGCHRRYCRGLHDNNPPPRTR